MFVSWKVLIAATAIRQLSRPFTSGKDGPGLDLRTVFWSGGMPSTHSVVSKMISHSLTVCFLQFFTILFAQRARFFCSRACALASLFAQHDSFVREAESTASISRYGLLCQRRVYCSVFFTIDLSNRLHRPLGVLYCSVLFFYSSFFYRIYEIAISCSYVQLAIFSDISKNTILFLYSMS
jgi:hypothetical protein